MAGTHIKLRGFTLLSLLALWLSACTRLPVSALPTPLPQGARPAFITRTSQASVIAPPVTDQPATDQPSPTQTSTAAPAAASPTPEQAAALPAVPAPVQELPASTAAAAIPLPTLLSSQAATALPPFVPTGIPLDRIEIRNLGPLSRVASPIHVYGALRTGAGSQARIELLGEDGRLLYGETRVFNVPEGAQAVLSMDIDFEIAAPAETARLQIYVQDAYGRVTALNSVPLILLSLGDSDIDPPGDVLAPILIQQPARKALVQGGVLLVAGLARVPPGSTLLARFLSEEGRQVGMRLAGVDLPPQGGYGSFAVEVPYTVSAPTPALLVVSLGDSGSAGLTNLTSLEVLLSP